MADMADMADIGIADTTEGILDEMQQGSGPRPRGEHATTPSPDASLRALAPERPRSATPPAVTHATCVLQGRTVPYTVRISPRARVLRLVIRHESGLEVVAPRGTAFPRIQRVLAEKAAWIVRTLDRMERERAASVLPPLQSGRVLPFAGRVLTLRVATGAPPGRYRVSLAGDLLTLTVHDAE